MIDINVGNVFMNGCCEFFIDGEFERCFIWFKFYRLSKGRDLNLGSLIFEFFVRNYCFIWVF